MKYIALGMKEGARLVTGGSRYGSKGMFVIPTIFADVKVSSRLQIPALVVNAFKKEINAFVWDQSSYLFFFCFAFLLVLVWELCAR